MKTYIISLKSEAPKGVKGELFSAKTDGNLSRFRWWCAMLRPALKGEIGCAASHRALWEKCVQLGEPIVVLEEDVVTNAGYDRALEVAARQVREHPKSVVLLSEHSDDTRTGVIGAPQGSYRVEPITWDFCSEAYVIGVEAARNLVWAQRKICAPSDSWGRWVRKGLIDLYHLNVPVCNQYEHVSTIGTTYMAPQTGLRKLWWKTRRAIGYAIDGLLDHCKWGC